MRRLSKWQVRPAFHTSHPSKYQPRSTLLNFGDQTGTSVYNVTYGSICQSYSGKFYWGNINIWYDLNHINHTSLHVHAYVQLRNSYFITIISELEVISSLKKFTFKSLYEVKKQWGCIPWNSSEQLKITGYMTLNSPFPLYKISHDFFPIYNTFMR
jgi:hypothetical protein